MGSLKVSGQMNADVLWLDIISIARCSKNRAIVSEECAPSSQPTSNSLRPVELHATNIVT